MTLALATELDEINQQFSAALHALEAALRSDEPDLVDLGKRRTALARHARVRLNFIDGKLCPLLAAGPTPAHGAAARQLRQRIGDIFAASNRHIGDWSSADIAADWDGYRDATRAMAAQVKALLAMERRDVYPLLATAV
ncbi:MAG: hypothetical protein J0J06_01525 [Sphingomonas sp.]|uniref:hypothetical protein n=1 Tax=Sphingomonas sp. TaxID=28214 RepID=UPI001AC1D37D|nr:hypothetical protein [Sphingomonas sp.]MBN8814110.1 hypothetical protein [Sphingomonas sp.]